MENKRRNILKVIKFYKGKISNGDEVSKEEIQKLKELVNEQGRMAKVITNKNEMIKILKEIMEQQEEGKTDRIVCVNELGTNVKLCVNGAVTITRQEYKTVRIIKHKGDIRIAYYAPDDEFID